MIAATSGLRPAHLQNAHGKIGPNAILQMIPVLDAHLGRPERDHLLTRAGIRSLPDGTGMINEGPVAALHQQVRQDWPDMSIILAQEAGAKTADYILAHRIPAFAQLILKALPWPIAAKLLSKAIGRNAWTFAGSGDFEVLSRLSFRLYDNPVITGETSDHTLCHWHAAVFERLYQVLVHPDLTCTETCCHAQGAEACIFGIAKRGKQPT